MKKLFVMLTIVLAVGVGVFYFFMGEDILADFYINSAKNQTDIVKAVKLYKKGLELQPENISARNNLVDIYIHYQNFELAQIEITKGLEANDNNVELFLKRVKLYQNMGEIKTAIESMDNIENNFVNTNLNVKRSAIPNFNYNSGTYNEVLTIELSANIDCLIYYSINNEEYIIYEKPFVLNEGYTIINAITISFDGVISQVIQNDYEIKDIVTPVIFTNDNITIEILNQVSSLDPLYANDTEILDLSNQNIANVDLQSITNFENITTLILGDVTEITNFECLKNMKNLKSIEINKGLMYQEFIKIINLSKLEEVIIRNSYISSLPVNTNSLKKLTIKNSFLNDISNINTYKTLTYLDLSFNDISNINNISEVKKINYLNLAYNNIENISKLENLVSIQKLYLNNNLITILNPVTNLLFLEEIDISNNQVVTVRDLANLKYLHTLRCSFNNIITLEPLIESKSLMYIYANDNAIIDISYMSLIENLSYLNVENNNIIKY